MSSATPSVRAQTGLRADGSALNVLLLDDEELLRKALRRILEFDGFRVQDFASGEEALSAIPSFKPDVVVSDVRMPDLDGVEVLVRIKKTTPELAVLLLSGYVDPDFETEAKRMGAYRVLVKPISVVDLESCIRQAVGQPPG